MSSSSQLSTAVALAKLSSIDIGYIPWTSSSMTPEAIVHILNELTINRKRTVLELGMGVSTFYLARILRDIQDCRLISVDHDATWIAVCQKQREVKNLNSDRHEIVFAPLVACPLQDSSPEQWYDIAEIKKRCDSLKPDLLIIDGPPAWKSDLTNARIPAYEMLSGILADDATVVIDDFRRPGEALLLEKFLSDPSWKPVLADENANVAIVRRSGAVAFNIT